MAMLLLGLTLALAFANGANDVSKGIATLVGSGVTVHRRAVLWGSLWTTAGAVTGAVVASGLVATFSGAGLLGSHPEGSPFAIAVALGAIGWLAIATAVGLPVSTTHALLGGICRSGIAAAGFDGVLWGVVGRKAAIPLAASPGVSLALMFALSPLLRLASCRFTRYCVCVERAELVTIGSGGTLAVGESSPRVMAGVDCPLSGTGRPLDVVRHVVSRVRVVNSLHWLTAGFTSFARGMNDAPKIVALGVSVAATLRLAPTPSTRSSPEPWAWAATSQDRE